MIRVWNNLRLMVASVILGRGWYGAIMRLWLIHDRARAAITPEGQVVLAECKALSDALYAPIPGEWEFRLSLKQSCPASATHGMPVERQRETTLTGHRDKERLDWLEAHASTVMAGEPMNYRDINRGATSLRASIDLAMEGKW